MISNPQLLREYKARMLKTLNDYAGVAARETQLLTDFQINYLPAARLEDVQQVLMAIKNDGNAERRLDDHRGWLWVITPSGHRVAERLILEDD